MRPSGRRAHHPQFNQRDHRFFYLVPAHAFSLALADIESQETSGIWDVSAWWLVSENNAPCSLNYQH